MCQGRTKEKMQAAVVPVTDREGKTILEQDELVRPDLTLDQLALLSPAFAEQGAAGFDALMLQRCPDLQTIRHVHSMANCPGMADGAGP